MSDILDTQDKIDRARNLAEVVFIAANGLQDPHEANALSELASILRNVLDEAKDMLCECLAEPVKLPDNVRL
jgi:hypothetical protein